MRKGDEGMKPARLGKVETGRDPIEELFNADIMIQIKFWIVFIAFIIVGCLLVFMSKGQTYGYL